MNKRERILKLVQDGSLSIDEGLDLLENLSEEENIKKNKNDFIQNSEEEIKKSKQKKSKVENNNDDNKEKINLDELETIANEINQYSVEIDQLNKEIDKISNKQLIEEEKLNNIKDNQKEKFSKRKNELEREIISLNKEINLISSRDELEYENDLDLLKKELNEVLEDLYLLENSKELNQEIKSIENKIKKLEDEKDQFKKNKKEKMKEIHSLTLKKWTTKAKEISNTMALPKNWRENATKTIDKAGKFIDENTQNISGFLQETMKKTKDKILDIDWDEMNIDLSIKEKASFSHEWLYEDVTASILDFKNANGNIHFKQSKNDSIKIKADIKLYEKNENLTPLEDFEKKSSIQIDSDHFKFYIPNKKVKANLVIYLPKRNYDYIRINTIKGNVSFDELLVNDLYVRINSGDLLFKKLEASMLEVSLSKGNLRLEDALLRDLLVNMTSGDLRVIGDIRSSDLTTISGDILFTLTSENFTQLTARSVKGDLKLALPVETSFDVKAKIILGKVKSRLTNSDKSLEDESENKIYRFSRIANGKLGQIKLETTRGNILLKDYNKEKRKGE